MKNLTIGNYENLKGYEIKNWMIYNSAEMPDEYIFRLKRIDGHTKHAAVSFLRDISEWGISIRVMYESYSNKVWTGNVPLSDLKNKESLWLLLESYIEQAHINR
jgi:hypothetical protein